MPQSAAMGRNQRILFVSVLLLMSGALAGAFVWAMSRSSALAVFQEGESLPAEVARAVAGEWPRSPLHVMLFSVSCGPCDAQLDVLAGLPDGDRSAIPFHVVIVDSRLAGDASLIRDRTGATVSTAARASIAEQSGAVPTPLHVLLDADHRVITTKVGVMNAGALRQFRGRRFR